MKRNLYHILGVDATSSRERIKEAYKEAVLRFHPDRNKAIGAEEEFLAIQQAYETLGDTTKKLRYDVEILEENNAFPIEINVSYSRNAVTSTTEAQLLYTLLDINCKIHKDPAAKSAYAIAMVVDTSTSMSGDRLDSVKRSLLALVKQLHPDDLFCVVAFNDQAHVVIPLTKIRDFDDTNGEISHMVTAGGTEMFHGLRLGLDLLSGKKAEHYRKQLVIFTDGNTYGDEDECLILARRAAQNKVVISGFGFGGEWNDEFLDKLTSITGGDTRFVAGSWDLDRYVEEKFSEFSQLFSQSVKFIIAHRQDIVLNSAFRLHPNPGPVEIEETSLFGNVKFSSKLSVLLEFKLPPGLPVNTKFRLGQGFITVDSSYLESEIRKFVTFDTAVSSQRAEMQTPAEIGNALAIITMYRIQEKARQDVINGHPEQAIIKLSHLINHLTELGHHALVKQVLAERDSIISSGKFSRSGDKTIKYGTRALLLPGNYR